MFLGSGYQSFACAEIRSIRLEGMMLPGKGSRTNLLLPLASLTWWRVAGSKIVLLISLKSPWRIFTVGMVLFTVRDSRTRVPS